MRKHGRIMRYRIISFDDVTNVMGWFIMGIGISMAGLAVIYQIIVTFM